MSIFWSHFCSLRQTLRQLSKLPVPQRCMRLCQNRALTTEGIRHFILDPCMGDHAWEHGFKFPLLSWSSVAAVPWSSMVREQKNGLHQGPFQRYCWKHRVGSYSQVWTSSLLATCSLMPFLTTELVEARGLVNTFGKDLPNSHKGGRLDTIVNNEWMDEWD